MYNKSKHISLTYGIKNQYDIMCDDQIFHFENICKLTQLILVNVHLASDIRKKKKKEEKNYGENTTIFEIVRRTWILIIPPPSVVVRKELKS